MTNGGPQAVARARWLCARTCGGRGVVCAAALLAATAVMLAAVPGAFAAARLAPWAPATRAAAPSIRPHLRSPATTAAERAQRAPRTGGGLARARAAGSAIASPASAAVPGGISGHVTSAAHGEPLDGIVACAFSEEGFAAEGPLGEEQEPSGFVGCAVTGATGTYTIAGLQPARYVVEFFPEAEAELNYVIQFFDGVTLESEATLVPVKAGETTPAIDAALQEGGKIAGAVTESAGNPQAGIEVCAGEGQPESRERCAFTDAKGEYMIVGLAAGMDYVRFGVPFEFPGTIGPAPPNLAPQFYEKASTRADATPVHVVVGATRAGIDAKLSAGGRILGTVTRAGSNVGLAQIEVCAASRTEFVFRCTLTDAGGRYELVAFASGEYELEFFSNDGEYKPAFRAAVPVTAGDSTDVDETLSVEVPILREAPRISGAPVEGVLLSVTHGAWRNGPTAYKDEWGRCTSASVITSCHPLAVGESYKLSAADLGYMMRVRETAENSGGSAFAYSQATSPVAVPAPGVNTTVVFPVPPHSGSLASVTSAPSGARLMAFIERLLVPAGRHAKIGALLKRGEYSVSVDAPAAGQLVLSWYLVPSGAHLASARPVLIAAGGATLTAAGVSKLTIKLTTKGKRLLRHAARIRLTAKGTFTVSGHGAVSTTGSFTLKR